MGENVFPVQMIVYRIHDNCKLMLFTSIFMTFSYANKTYLHFSHDIWLILKET